MELVDQDIRFGSPDRISIAFRNRDQAAADLMLCHLALGAPGDGTPNTWNGSTNERGYRLESLGDGTMGHPVAPFHAELTAAEDIRVPGLRRGERMSAVPAFLKTCGDRYPLASFDLSGLTVYALLRGFENALRDLLLHPKASRRLSRHGFRLLQSAMHGP